MHRRLVARSTILISHLSSLLSSSRPPCDELEVAVPRNADGAFAAAGTVNAILDAAESLVGFPYTGSPVRGLPFTAEEYRFTNTRNYLIFYRVTDACIFVDRILYKRRDYIPLLGLQ